MAAIERPTLFCQGLPTSAMKTIQLPDLLILHLDLPNLTNYLDLTL